jgi:sugar transferase (PEP-CTERM/EpsH1 system associated)
VHVAARTQFFFEKRTKKLLIIWHRLISVRPQPICKSFLVLFFKKELLSCFATPEEYLRNLLFLSHCMPWPPNKGEKIRAWNILRHLSAKFHVHVGCVVDDPAALDHVSRLRDICASVGAFPIDRRRQKYRALLHARPGKPLMPDFYFAPALQRWVDETAALVRFDAVYIYTVAMFPYVAALAGATRILDAVDIDSEKWAEYALKSRYPMRAVWAREGRTLLAYERQAAAACERTLFVSAPEAARFAALAPEVAARVAAVENGVDLERFSPERVFVSPFDDTVHNVVFTGTMDYWPNADAVIHFAQDILPALTARVPGIEFWVVGANPGPAVQVLGGLPGVHVTGRVEDVRPYVAHASAIVCPLRLARGIQNKVLEGMAMGRPVVASLPAFEGVRAQAGRDVLVAEGVQGWVDALCDVLEGRRAELGGFARAAMEHAYAWSSVLSALDRVLNL